MKNTKRLSTCLTGPVVDSADVSSPLRRRSGTLASAAIICFTLLLAGFLHAGAKPFEPVEEDSYSGRFVGPDVTFRLKPEAGKWTGTINFKGQNYTIQGQNQNGKLAGTFGAGNQSWPFSATSGGDKLTFTVGTFTSKLTRQKLPKLAGVYASERVNLVFQNHDGGLNGTINLNGKQFQFTATERAGDLVGVFKQGEEAFQFMLVNDPAGPTFQTGKFSEVLRWTPQQWLKATIFASGTRWTNSLGMVFAKVPGTEVLFSIWDTRVQDYQAYAASGKNIDGSWKNPGFTQTPIHPVVKVSWNDAKAFCQWLTEQERADGIISGSQSYRLPTDAEWSLAVGLPKEKGSTPGEKSIKIKNAYPWGAQWPPPSGAGNYDPSLGADNFKNTSSVESFAAKQFGLYDMGGNVWQWCEDWYDGEQKSRVLRGAAWCDGRPVVLLSSFRLYGEPVLRSVIDGFRCMLVEGAAP